jgi:homospermidine synthase
MRAIVIGMGSIGQAVMPVLCKRYQEIVAVVVSAAEAEIARQRGAHIIVVAQLTSKNVKAVLSELLVPGSVLVNVSVEVSSIALARLCAHHDCNYLDTCNEPWAGGYLGGDAYARSNARLRGLWKLTARGRMSGLSVMRTAVSCSGANPGWVSHVARDALMDVAKARGALAEDVTLDQLDAWTRSEWANLAKVLRLTEIHIAEADTQQLTDGARRRIVPLLEKTLTGEALVNTWSPSGFASEALEQHCEFTYATVDGRPCYDIPRVEGAVLPADMRRLDGQQNVAFGVKRGYLRAHSYVPSLGEYKGYVITHNEALSLAEYFASDDWRPGALYVYRPFYWARRFLKAPGAAENAARLGAALPSCVPTANQLRPDGFDELGVLLVFEDGTRYWKGSRLSVADVKAAGWQCQNPTGAQVVGGIVGALDFIARRPYEGCIEAEDIPASEGLASALPYLGSYFGVFAPR